MSHRRFSHSLLNLRIDFRFGRRAAIQRNQKVHLSCRLHPQSERCLPSGRQASERNRIWEENPPSPRAAVCRRVPPHRSWGSPSSVAANCRREFAPSGDQRGESRRKKLYVPCRRAQALRRVLRRRARSGRQDDSPPAPNPAASQGLGRGHANRIAFADRLHPDVEIAALVGAVSDHSPVGRPAWFAFEAGIEGQLPEFRLRRRRIVLRSPADREDGQDSNCQGRERRERNNRPSIARNDFAIERLKRLRRLINCRPGAISAPFSG